MPNLSLAIIDTDSRARDQLTEIVGTFGDTIEILSATASFEDALRQILESQPHIVILDVRDIGQGARETSAIVSRSPETAVFVTCNEKNPDWIIRLIRAGAGEYLTKPIIAGELVDAIKKVSRSYLQSSEPKGCAIAVYHPAGGVGTTTTAVNLAAALAARGEKVALLDLNPLTPDIATFLDLTPRYTMADVVYTRGELDASFLKSVMTPHASGVQVLAGPTNLGDAPDHLQPEQVGKMMGVLKSLFSYTVIDTGGDLSRSNLAAFQECDHILYTTVLNLPGLKNAKLYFAALDAHGLGRDKVKLVINRFVTKDDIDLSSVEKILHVKTYARLPNAYLEVKSSLNRGEPLVSSYPRAQLTKAIGDLAVRLMQDTAAAGETKQWRV